MSINKYIRHLIVNLYTPRPPKLPKKPLKIVLAFRNIISSIKFIIGTTFKILLLIPFVAFVVVWVYVFSLYLSGHYLIRFGEEGSTQLAIIGIPVIMIAGLFFYSRNETAVQNAFWQTLNNFQKTKLYKRFCDWVSKITTFYFVRFLLPNIDLIEPGLMGQNIDTFPEVIFYEDSNFKNVNHIRKIISNHYSFSALIVIVSVIVGLIAIPIILPTVIALLNLLTFGILRELLNFIGVVFFLIAYVLSILSIFIPTHPESILRKRTIALSSELQQLIQEEQLLVTIAEFQNEVKISIESYNQQLSRIRTKLSDEYKKLDGLQKEALMTQENIESTKNFVVTNPGAALLLLDQQDEHRENKEKKIRWKNWLIDIILGIISAILYGVFFGK